MDIRGKDYLQVAYRLVWFREDHPDWAIETSVDCDFEKTRCIGKALIRDAQGRLIATAHKVEDKLGFADYLEKAETGAIGRALALCGYGTQFCAEELDEGNRLADSPLGRKSPVSPGQPGPDDGITEPSSYKIPFGKWSQRSIEEIYNTQGADAIASYIQYLEDAAIKKGKTIDGVAREFIERASAFIAAMEQNWAKENGARQ
jgi:hypothetical protein